ncbi:hypothetical protein ARMGADRAFT_925171, partial [Armillaria gallica]
DKLAKLWKAAAYAFFAPLPEIEYSTNGCVLHSFRCLSCDHKVTQCPDTADAGSTGALWHHIWKCWGDEVLSTADNAKDLKKSCHIVDKELCKRKPKNGSIVSMLKRFGSKIISYSTHPHTKMETQAEIVRWCAESLQPFNVVADCGFKSLMKTSWPEHYLPHPKTMSWDMKTYNIIARHELTIITQKLNGLLSFATDAWMLPNHQAYVASTVHFMHDDGTPTRMVLDFIEVPKVRRTYLALNNMLIGLVVSYWGEFGGGIAENNG